MNENGQCNFFALTENVVVFQNYNDLILIAFLKQLILSLHFAPSLSLCVNTATSKMSVFNKNGH